MKDTWKSLLVIIVSALIYSLLQAFIPGRYHLVLKFIFMVMLLVIGYSLSNTRKRNNRWVGKVFISLLVVFIFGIKLNWFSIPEFNRLLSKVGLTGSFLNVLIIYCGWAFHQV